MVGYCTACGRPRSPLVTTPVELAGRPSRIGGTVARVFAWAILVFGLLAAIVVAVILLTLTSTGPLGWVLGGVIALAALAIGIPLLVGGRALQKMGTQARQNALERAVFALAATHGGTITAGDLARSLRVSVDEADAFLTDLAKRPDEPVKVDIDDDGRVLFRVVGAVPKAPRRRYRVSEDGRRVEEGDVLAEEEEEEEAEAERRREWRDST